MSKGRRSGASTLAQAAKRTAVVTHYTEPPEGSTIVCIDELGPLVPCTFDSAPGWSANGHRIKAPVDYERGPEKTWVYGASRVRDGKELTRCAVSRNSKGYIALLADIEADNPSGDLFIISDNLSSHNSLETRTWLEEHPRTHHIFIPDFRMLAQSAGGVVAPLPPRCAGRAKRDLSQGDRASHPRCYCSTQSAGKALGLGTSAQGSPPLSPTLLLPYLTNPALVASLFPL
jgi:hypothetical protein